MSVEPSSAASETFVILRLQAAQLTEHTSYRQLVATFINSYSTEYGEQQLVVALICWSLCVRSDQLTHRTFNLYVEQSVHRLCQCSLHTSVPPLHSELTSLPLRFAHFVWTAEHPERVLSSGFLVLIFLLLCSFPGTTKKKRGLLWCMSELLHKYSVDTRLFCQAVRTARHHAGLLSAVCTAQIKLIICGN